MAIDLVHAAAHASVFAALLIPIGILLGMLKCYRGKFAKVFMLLIAGLLPMALFHLFESFAYFGVELVPGDYEVVLEHAVSVVAVLTVARFLHWFNAQYVRPFCEFRKKRK